MPRIKEIDSLQTMADRVLLESVLQSCNQPTISVWFRGSVDGLREGVAAIKYKIFNRMPPILLADFVSRFLDKFYSDELEESQCQAVLEIAMDIEIVGLRLRGPILKHLDQHQAHRFQRLTELHLEGFSCHYHLEKFLFEKYHLNDLVTLVYPQRCTDSDLEVLGKQCPMLEVLTIKNSEHVSDEGLRDLSPCSNLRVLDVGNCPNVTYVGLNHLLSVHKHLEDLSYGYDVDYDYEYRYAKLHVLSGLDMTVEAPSMRRFVFENDHDGDWFSVDTEGQDVGKMDPLIFVAKFPNLNYLQINCKDLMDLSALRYLTKLTGLELNFMAPIDYDLILRVWENIMKVLTEIGARIITLKLAAHYRHGFSWEQKELNFIFNCCPNIEHLEFDYVEGRSVVPPFANLKVLIPRIPVRFPSLDLFEDQVLEFGTMPNLETLSLLNFRVDLQTVKSMMLDDVKFPKLSTVKANALKADDFVEIEAIARSNNLEFRVEDDPAYDWYVEEFLRHSSQDTE